MKGECILLELLQTLNPVNVQARIYLSCYHWPSLEKIITVQKEKLLFGCPVWSLQLSEATHIHFLKREFPGTLHTVNQNFPGQGQYIDPLASLGCWVPAGKRKGIAVRRHFSSLKPAQTLEFWFNLSLSGHDCMYLPLPSATSCC